MITALMVFRACLVANGNRDPQGGAQGMFDNTAPPEREYCQAIADALNTMKDEA